MADNVAIYLQKGFLTLKHLVLTKSSYMRNPLMTTRHQDPRRDSFFNINLEKNVSFWKPYGGQRFSNKWIPLNIEIIQGFYEIIPAFS